MRFLRVLLPSALLGALLALCGLPLPWSALTPLPLAAALWWMATGAGGGRQRVGEGAPTWPGGVTGRAFWTMSVFFAVQLWWLTRFAADLSGLPEWTGALMMLPLFLLEGAFWALMAGLVTRPLTSPLARTWALAGGWVLLEWLRTLGPLAFPWSGLGYTLLPTPLAQTGDLWGTLGLSLTVAATAAALVSLAHGRWRPALLLALVWVGGGAYGLTRTPQNGPARTALLFRTTFDSFGRASGDLTPDQQFARLSLLSGQRRPGEVLIWSETAIFNPFLLTRAPAPGLYGVYLNGRNTAQSWDGARVGDVLYDKLKPVPFGEFFPFSDVARPLYALIFRQLGFAFDPPAAGSSTAPLPLQGVLYGVYICYDSIFSWVARQETLQGAQVLVNISNDGWYKGWGVQQHFQMGRMRAVETRRWVLRSVNEGVAAAIDDLGQPVQVRAEGEGTLHAEYRVLDGRTLYVRLGDAPALLLAALLLLYALRLEGRERRRRF